MKTTRIFTRMILRMVQNHFRNTRKI
jgi:hypothetical protein